MARYTDRGDIVDRIDAVAEPSDILIAARDTIVYLRREMAQLVRERNEMTVRLANALGTNDANGWDIDRDSRRSAEVAD